IYVKDEKKSDQKAVVKYIDKTDGNKLLESDETVGKSGEKINYSTDSKIKELTDKGYVLVKDGFPKDGIFDDNDKEDQIFEVILEHGVAPVGPNDPHEPGTPINPMDPEGPKWLDKDNYSKEYTSTIHYVDEKGNTVSVDNVQTSVWGRTLQVDKVTGEILNPDEAWVSDKQNYDEVKTPTVNGYYADKVKVPSKAVEQQNLTETVVYKPLGKVVPVDPEGNLIPGAETPIYTNDPKDPTKGGETPIPEIPGYRPEIPGQTTVVPKDPGKDTP
ncbi:mucin-binding protein, partial [Enterococcus faecalis]|uniref:mucin-binding protein n=1 Tax=Enterococcus faecalis TaxID=1351 RepID=UPI001D1829F5